MASSQDAEALNYDSASLYRFSDDGVRIYVIPFIGKNPLEKFAIVATDDTTAYQGSFVDIEYLNNWQEDSVIDANVVFESFDRTVADSVLILDNYITDTVSTFDLINPETEMSVSSMAAPTVIVLDLYDPNAGINSPFMFFNLFIWANINPGTTGIGSGLPPTPGGGYYGGIGPAGSGNNNNCNPSGPSAHTPTFIPIIEFSADPSVDLAKMFKCLDDVSSTGATYKVALMTQLPNQNDVDDFIFGTGGGHAFITIEKTNGSTVVKQSFGMYPDAPALMPGGATVSIDNRFVDDGLEDVDGRMVMTITHSQYLTLKAEALSFVNGQYDMNDKNCADFALSVFNSVRGSDPIEVDECWSFGVRFRSMPQRIFKKFNEMITANHPEKGNITINLTSMMSPTSAGECN